MLIWPCLIFPALCWMELGSLILALHGQIDQSHHPHILRPMLLLPHAPSPLIHMTTSCPHLLQCSIHPIHADGCRLHSALAPFSHYPCTAYDGTADTSKLTPPAAPPPMPPLPSVADGFPVSLWAYPPLGVNGVEDVMPQIVTFG